MNDNTIKRMSEGEWVDTFKPIDNPYTENAECQFETNGKDLVFVQNAARLNPNTIWTLIEVDGEGYIIPGFHFVNRYCYYVTTNPWDNENIEINVWHDTADEEE